MYRTLCCRASVKKVLGGANMGVIGQSERFARHRVIALTTVLFDEWLGKYPMYIRLYPTVRRVIGISESDDFRHWDGVRPWCGRD